MPTTVVKTIGTSGRDYSTLQAWEDACPANLVTADQIWRGECYNDTEFSAALTIAGETTDATRYVMLTAAAGQSFQDNAGVRSNALTYDRSKGVGLLYTGVWTAVITVSAQYSIISRLQVKTTASTSYPLGYSNVAILTKDCIFDFLRAIASAYNACTFVNCLFVSRVSANNVFGGGSGGTFIGCTAIKPSDVTPGGTFAGIDYSSTGILESCAIFGFTAIKSGVGSFDGTNSKNNATNLASGLPGSSNQHSVTYNSTAPFTSALAASLDARAIAATALVGNGYRDWSNAPNDISGTARAASPTIGAWEYVASGTVWVLAGAASGLARGVAALALTRKLASTAAGVSSGSSGALKRFRGLAASAAGVSSCTGALMNVRRFAAAAAGISSGSALLGVVRQVASTARGASSCTGALRVVSELAGTTAGRIYRAFTAGKTRLFRRR
jgi:hypothetical protein